MILGERVTAPDWETQTGWHLEPHGLCNGDRCIPTATVASIDVGGASFGTEAVAALCGRGSYRFGDMVTVGPEFGPGFGALRGAPLPDIGLEDRAGQPVRMATLAGRRRRMVIHAWAPW